MKLYHILMKDVLTYPITLNIDRDDIMWHDAHWYGDGDVKIEYAIEDGSARVFEHNLNNHPAVVRWEKQPTKQDIVNIVKDTTLSYPGHSARVEFLDDKTTNIAFSVFVDGVWFNGSQSPPHGDEDEEEAGPAWDLASDIEDALDEWFDSDDDWEGGYCWFRYVNTYRNDPIIPELED